MNKNKIYEAFKSYTEGQISMGKAAEVADVSIQKFLDLMKERKIPLRYDFEDIKKETEKILKEDMK